MKFLCASLALSASVILLASCETNLRTAPAVTSAFVRLSARESANPRTLEEGRRLYVNRCIACHALPAIGRYDSKRIPGIVNWMSHRASLTPEQKEALIMYLLAVKSKSP
jgi:hypothetical protein